MTGTSGATPRRSGTGPADSVAARRDGPRHLQLAQAREQFPDAGQDAHLTHALPSTRRHAFHRRRLASSGLIGRPVSRSSAWASRPPLMPIRRRSSIAQVIIPQKNLTCNMCVTARHMRPTRAIKPPEYSIQEISLARGPASGRAGYAGIVAPTPIGIERSEVRGMLGRQLITPTMDATCCSTCGKNVEAIDRTVRSYGLRGVRTHWANAADGYSAWAAGVSYGLQILFPLLGL